MLHLYRVNAEIQISSMLNHFPPLGYLVNTTFHHETLILCDCVSADRGVKGGRGRQVRAAIDIGYRKMRAMQRQLRECPPTVAFVGRRHRREERRNRFQVGKHTQENKINTEAVDDDAEAFISRSSDSQMGNRVLILEGQ